MKEGVKHRECFTPSFIVIVFSLMRTPLCKISSTGEIEQRFRLN